MVVEKVSYPMKYLIKISIGSIAFIAFCTVCVPIYNAQITSQSENVKTKKELLDKGDSRFYTKAGYKMPVKCEHRRSVPGVIYLGEPTEGLLD